MKKTVVFLLLLAICVSANAAFEEVYSGRLPMANFEQFIRIEETVASGNHRYLFTTNSGFGYMSLDGGLAITDFSLWGYKGAVKSLQGKDDDVIFLYGPAINDIDAGVYKVDGGGGQYLHQSNDELFGMTTVDSYTYLIRGGATSLTAKVTILDYSNLSHTFTQPMDSMVHSDNGDATVIKNPMNEYIFYVHFPSHPVMYYVDIRPSAGRRLNPYADVFKEVGTNNILTCAVSHNNSSPRMMITRSDGLFEILNIDPASGAATTPNTLITKSYFVETGNEDAVMHTSGPYNDFYLVCSPRNAVFNYDAATDVWDVTSAYGNVDGIYGDQENHYIFVSNSMNDFSAYRGWAFPSRDIILFNESTTPLDTPVAVHEEDDFYMLCSMWGNVQLSNTPLVGQGVFGTFNAYTPPIHGINEIHSSMSGCMESGGDRFGLLNSDGVTKGTLDKVHDVFNFNSRKTLHAEGAALQKPMLFINGEMWIAEETGIGILPVGADTYSQVIELDPVMGRPAVMIYDDVRNVVLGGYLKNFFAIVASNKNMLCNDPFPNIGMAWSPLWRSLVYNKTDQHCYYKTTSATGGADICVTSLANYSSPNFSDTFTHTVDVYSMEIFDSGVLAFTDATKVIYFGKMGTNAVFQQIEQASYPAPTSDQGFQLYGGNFMLIYQFNRGDYSVWRFTDIQPPINVHAYALSHMAVKVHWEDPNGNTLYFEIERRLYPAGTWELAGTVASDVLEFIDVGLQPATEYEYRVFAFSDLGPSNPSNAVLAQTTSSNDLYMIPYPNPTTGPITLEGLSTTGRIILYTPDGARIEEWDIPSESFTFDISDLGGTELLSGKYFIVYQASDQAEREERVIFYVRPEQIGCSK